MSTNFQFQIGDEVTFSRSIQDYTLYGGPLRTFVSGEPMIVRQVGVRKIRVKNLHQSGLEMWVDIDLVMPLDPNAPRPPKPRKLGEKPEGDEFLDPWHPGLTWLWDDVAKYASNNSYCATFDRILSDLGLPGRPKNYGVVREISGLKANFNVMARSQEEAEAEVDRKLKEAIE